MKTSQWHIFLFIRTNYDRAKDLMCEPEFLNAKKKIKRDCALRKFSNGLDRRPQMIFSLNMFCIAEKRKVVARFCFCTILWRLLFVGQKMIC